MWRRLFVELPGSTNKVANRHWDGYNRITLYDVEPDHGAHRKLGRSTMKKPSAFLFAIVFLGGFVGFTAIEKTAGKK